MNRQQFIKRLKRLSKKTGMAVRVDSKTGKGSHGRVYYGDKFTTVVDHEIGTGLLNAMLKQLDIKKSEF